VLLIKQECSKQYILINRKLGDGLFIKKCREEAQKYPQIVYMEENIDTLCMKLARNPTKYDVMVMPNLYGDIVSDLCAGFIGGLGLTQSGNFGTEAACFEAVHGTAPDIAGKNLANPTALLLSAVMMLRHLNLHDYADKIQFACHDVLKDVSKRTKDLGGTASTSEYTQAIISHFK
jgi:isocitrate dehydrogenase (NAD+)